MRKCIRCGRLHMNKRVCSDCLDEWASMRLTIWEAMERRHGVFCSGNLDKWKADTKKLEAVWKKDKQEFNKQIELINLEN